MYVKGREFFNAIVITQFQFRIGSALRSLSHWAHRPELVATQEAVRDETDPYTIAEIVKEAFLREVPRRPLEYQVRMLDSLAYHLAAFDQDFCWALEEARNVELTRRFEDARARAVPGRAQSEHNFQVYIISESDCCSACFDLGGQVRRRRSYTPIRYTIAEARSQRILPHAQCMSQVRTQPGFCRCRYKPC
jgi:hypothetical protein